MKSEALNQVEELCEHDEKLKDCDICLTAPDLRFDPNIYGIILMVKQKSKPKPSLS